MDKKTIVNNGWVTDVAVACDDNVTVDSALFESCITHADVRELVYSDESDTTAVVEPVTVVEEVVEPQDVVETSTESVLLEEDLKEVIDEPEVVDEPAVVDESVAEPDPVEPEA